MFTGRVFEFGSAAFRAAAILAGMKLRVGLQFRRAMYNLRGGFLIRPLVIALSLGSLGAIFSRLEESFPRLTGWAPLTLFPAMGDPQVAQIILAAIAGSIMTVVSIVFAILLMTLTLASMQFSPRIIVNFVQDSFTQWTLGIFLGTFLYCIVGCLYSRSDVAMSLRLLHSHSRQRLRSYVSSISSGIEKL